MYRAQYRHFADHDALLMSTTVDATGGNVAGVRWAELRNSGSGWSLFQEGTYAPADGLNRWMGSIAMNGQGDIAVGYSVASSTTYPSVRYTSRQSGDALGTLPGGEVEIVAGAGVQQSSSNRWGDYSAMSVDPQDDCTFWYTQEYYSNNGSFDFKTRIAALPGPSCAGGGGCIPTGAEICTGGADEDCDTFVDCDDTDCSLDPACASCVPVAEICTGGLDEDCDGFVDCDDSDCDLDPACTTCVPSTEICTNGTDDDCDGLVDCDDPDCAAAPACASCTLGQKGDACSSDGDCCSNKCKGKPGKKTCR